MVHALQDVYMFYCSKSNIRARIKIFLLKYVFILFLILKVYYFESRQHYFNRVFTVIFRHKKTPINHILNVTYKN